MQEIVVSVLINEVINGFLGTFKSNFHVISSYINTEADPKNFMVQLKIVKEKNLKCCSRSLINNGYYCGFRPS
jgi:hypothetical protein